MGLTSRSKEFDAFLQLSGSIKLPVELTQVLHLLLVEVSHALPEDLKLTAHHSAWVLVSALNQPLFHPVTACKNVIPPSPAKSLEL